MRTLAFIFTTLTLVAGCAAGSNPPVDAKAEEQAIRSLDQEWNTAIAKKSLDQIVAFYAPDAALLWADAPPARNATAVRSAWEQVLAVPGMTARIIPDRVEIAQAGDVALDAGTLEIVMETPQGKQTQLEKYLIVWKKVDGKWKAHYDMSNSNAPAPQSASGPEPKKG